MTVWHRIVLGVLTSVSGCATAAKPEAPWDSFRVSNAYAIFADRKVAELAVAAAKGDTKSVDRLVADGANVNAVGEYAQTPLFWSLYAHNKKGFQHLLEKGSDPNARDQNGDGVIHLAAEDEDPEFLQLALANRGNPNLRDSRGVFPTPIFRALQPIRNDNLRLLIASGADMNARASVTMETPMISAGNKYDKVYILMQAGADYRVADVWGYTIVRNIEHNGFDKTLDTEGWRDKVIDFLRQHGVEVHPRNS
jgi:ankyrin repeat protein